MLDQRATTFKNPLATKAKTRMLKEFTFFKSKHRFSLNCQISCNFGSIAQMISTNAFLPCTILGALESLKGHDDLFYIILLLLLLLLLLWEHNILIKDLFTINGYLK